MTDAQLVKILRKYLPAKLVNTALNYKIPLEFLEADPQLIELILTSKALSNPEEKQEWFDLLEKMTEEQILKLKDILLKERKKLAEIEEKYERKKREIRKKYLIKWQQLQARAQVHNEEEQKLKEDEIAEAEKLLEML
jgi:hypothetical protein